MKILHVCYSDVEGGAARAAHRLYKAQRKAGLDSYMLVVDKRTNDENVYKVSPIKKLYIQVIEKICQVMLGFGKTKNKTIRSINLFPTFLHQDINRIGASVINFHWVNKSMIQIGEIDKIKSPIVWTLHDMWAFCGTEHYDDMDDKERYQAGYTRESKLKTSSGIDFDRFTANRKKTLYNKKNIRFVTPSTWLKDCCSNSDILKMHDVSVIPNTLDKSIYKPLDKKFCREMFKLPIDKKLLLFGAMSSTSDPRKGFHLLFESVKFLKQKHSRADIEFIVFGSSEGEDLLGYKTHYLGSFSDDVSLSLLYNCADLFLAPSLQDNLPNTCLEALHCGVPCAAFDIGGMRDLISSESCGALARPFDAQEYAELIIDTISNVNIDASSSDILVDSIAVVERYNQVYNEVCQN